MNRPVGLRHSTRGCSASPNILSGVLSRTTFAQPLPSCVLLTAQFSRKSAASIAWAVFCLRFSHSFSAPPPPPRAWKGQTGKKIVCRVTHGGLQARTWDGRPGTVV